MRLELVEYEDLGRSMYVVYPEGERICCYENTLITVLRENNTESDIRSFLEDGAFRTLADSQRFIMLFPNPVGNSWNWNLEEDGPDDLSVIVEMTERFHYQPDMEDVGVYHIMHNARYFAGIDTGASMLYTLSVCRPVNIAGIFAVGGELSERALKRAAGAAVPAILDHVPEQVRELFIRLNAAECREGGRYYSQVNDAQTVILKEGSQRSTVIGPAEIQYAWENLFSRVCRYNSCIHGEPGPRMVKDHYPFLVHIDDCRLGDNGGIGHTWFEYIPEQVKNGTAEQVPLLIFNHGGADTPGNICNTIQLHETAEKENFILVYPWCSSKWSWNLNMDEEKYDDIAYLKALISYLETEYPIDHTRIYIGGFSNGSAMAQIFAMTNPELIAAVCADNTGFIKDRNAKPFAVAGQKKLQYDYRMPVWYIYGSRDREFPAVRGSGQQLQYDFWKSYNHIPCKPTPFISDPNTCGAGVMGDVVEEYCPNPRYPGRKYITHRFFSNDPIPVNYYNYTVAFGKGHDCNPEDGQLGWKYIRQFRRMPDGSLDFAVPAHTHV